MNLIGAQQIPKPKSIDLTEIDQFDAFRRIIGYTPKIGNYYKSILREDKTPGCRYELHRGILYFIDNKGYEDKIAFHLLQVIQILYSTDVYGAFEILRKNNIVPQGRVLSYKYVEKPIQIRIVPKFWTEDSILVRQGKISIDYLKHQPVYSVAEYWCSTRKDSRLKRNQINNPDKLETIAYHFASEHIKLYWPGAEEPKLKFYANISNDDIYGEHRYDEYVGENLFIVKSGKDDLVVNYHLGLNTLALQSETAKFTEHFLDLCEPFENLFIWYDNDETGKDYANRRSLELKSIFPHKNIFLLFVPNNKVGAKDPFDIVKNDWDLPSLFNLIYNNRKLI